LEINPSSRKVDVVEHAGILSILTSLPI